MSLLDAHMGGHYELVDVTVTQSIKTKQDF